MILDGEVWERPNVKSGNPQNFYLDGYLKKNLDGIPMFLKKDWDCVGIISGHGLVGVGKSTLAQQVGYYIAWLIAGGKIKLNKDNNSIIEGYKEAKREVKFDLNNIVFSPQELVETAAKLPRNSVIVYDEGRAGLQSSRAMELINKGMEDFFQECRQYGHVILIVLPNFFKLHEDYAVARSLFLIDVYADAKYNRGFFNFYNTLQKERLYYFGKKRIGVSAKYSSAYPNFYGKFSSWLPIDKDLYGEKKKEALKEKSRTRLQQKQIIQRDLLINFLRDEKKVPISEIQNIFNKVPGVHMAYEHLARESNKIRLPKQEKQVLIAV